jgi:diguanylate cyclase (GGDEF)-like protein
LSSKSASEYGEESVKVAEFVADHASQAFANARKYGEAQEMAYIDSLTNLYNAKYLELSLERELKRADRQKVPLTVLFLDVDHFKDVNDENDHIAGSKVLVEVGGIIKDAIREVDTAIRYGGDEYVVILVDAGCEAGFRVAERIRASVEEQTFLHAEGLDLKITVSIGVATYPVHTTEKSELLRIADSAMYTAKKSARNMVFLYSVPDKESS